MKGDTNILLTCCIQLISHDYVIIIIILYYYIVIIILKMFCE